MLISHPETLKRDAEEKGKDTEEGREKEREWENEGRRKGMRIGKSREGKKLY